MPACTRCGGYLFYSYSLVERKEIVTCVNCSCEHEANGSLFQASTPPTMILKEAAGRHYKVPNTALLHV